MNRVHAEGNLAEQAVWRSRFRVVIRQVVLTEREKELFADYSQLLEQGKLVDVYLVEDPFEEQEQERKGHGEKVQEQERKEPEPEPEHVSRWRGAVKAAVLRYLEELGAGAEAGKVRIFFQKTRHGGARLARARIVFPKELKMKMDVLARFLNEELKRTGFSATVRVASRPCDSLEECGFTEHIRNRRWLKESLKRVAGATRIGKFSLARSHLFSAFQTYVKARPPYASAFSADAEQNGNEQNSLSI